MHQAFRISVFTLILLAGFGFKSIVQSDGKRDGRRALFEDPVRFKQLSQAAQNLFQRKFGAKNAVKIPRSVSRITSYCSNKCSCKQSCR